MAYPNVSVASEDDIDTAALAQGVEMVVHTPHKSRLNNHKLAPVQLAILFASRMQHDRTILHNMDQWARVHTFSLCHC